MLGLKIALSTFFLVSIEAFSILHYHNHHLAHNQKSRLVDTKLNVEPVVIAGAIATVGVVTYVLNTDANNNNRRDTTQQYAEYEAREKERDRLAYIEPKQVWKEEELQRYNGLNDDERGPLLMAVKGDVFNVYKGRNFYGPGGEYHIMAGRDATRFLAKNRLEEESDEEKAVELNIAERANLEAWYWTIKNKYDRVGSLEGYDPKSTDM